MSRLFVQTYEAGSLSELQEKLLASLDHAQRTYVIHNIQVSHTHGSRYDAPTEASIDHFTALVVITAD